MKIAAAKQKEAIAALHSGASVADCRAFKEAGFRPKAVFRNLQPAHLYEKVRLRCIVFVCVCVLLLCTKALAHAAATGRLALRALNRVCCCQLDLPQGQLILTHHTIQYNAAGSPL